MELVASVKTKLTFRFFHLYALSIGLLLFLNACKEPESIVIEPLPVLTPVSVEVKHPEDILIVNKGLVPARLYSNISGLDSLPIQEKKIRFISALLPAILVAKHQLHEKRERFERLLTFNEWTQTDSAFFEELSETYRTTDTTKLRSAMLVHPNSIVLAQAAVESGWGNSRLFAEANNLIGIWSYRSDEPRVAASVKRGDQTIYLRKYKDFSESIADYFVTLGRSRHYAKFRRLRQNSDSVELLLPQLINYSERREEYVLQLNTMIRFNRLKIFDDYRLDSSYFVVPKAAKKE